jgi:prepilin peptidase CpaA
MIVSAALLLLTGAAALTDFRTRRIPNALTGAGIVTGLLLHTVADGWSGLGFSAAGMAAGFSLYLVLYAIRAMGAGDVKLMAAVGALAGTSAWFTIFVATAITGGIAALVLSVWKRRFHLTLWNVGVIAGELMRLRAPYVNNAFLDVKDPAALTLPHAVSIAAGTLLCLIWGPLS